MELITSSIDSAYKLTFSQGFRDTVKKSTPIDLLMVVLIAIVIVYILAKLFKGQYNTVCTKVFPIKENMDNHVSKKIRQLSELCTADTLSITVVDGNGFKKTHHMDYVKGQEVVFKLPQAIKAQKLLYNWDHHDDVKGAKIINGCPIGKVYVHLINLKTGKEESVKISHIIKPNKNIDLLYLENNSKLFTVTGFHISK